MKIFDASDSPKFRPIRKPDHAGNEVVAYLKRHTHRFGHVFVTSDDEADVIFTNDIFPEDYRGKFLVKRMDGVFYRKDNMFRNRELNAAAEQANHVIFISEYSRNSFFNLYPGAIVESSSVVCNEVDPEDYYMTGRSCAELIEVVAAAADWSRKEKRFSSLCMLAEMEPKIKFKVIGYFPFSGRDYDVWIPHNVESVGFMKNPKEISNVLRNSDAMVSLFYKDSYPKTMVQGIYSGLPVLYAASGGQVEMPVTGVSVRDNETYQFDCCVPAIKYDDLEDAWKEFKANFSALRKGARMFDGSVRFELMLSRYFGAMKNGVA